MKAIVKKTRKIVEVCGFLDDGRVELTDGTFMRPSEMVIDFEGKNENNLKLNTIKGNCIRKGKPANIIINIEKLSEYIVVANDDIEEEKLKIKIAEMLSKVINSISIDDPIKSGQENRQ